MEDSKRGIRRRHDASSRRRCWPNAAARRVGGASGDGARHQRQRRAQVAPASWRRQVRVATPEASTFVPVAMAPPACTSGNDIRIELRRGATCVNVTWPMAAAAQCAGWMRELLR